MDKRKVIIIASIIVIIVIALIIFGIVKYNTRIIDVSGAKHSVTIIENTDFYRKAKLMDVKIHKELPIGTNVYVLEDFVDEETEVAWSKVVIDNKIGYVQTAALGYYKASEDEKVLMVDLSKFNKGKNFDTGGDGCFLNK